MQIPPQAAIKRFTYLLFEFKVCHIINPFFSFKAFLSVGLLSTFTVHVLQGQEAL